MNATNLWGDPVPEPEPEAVPNHEVSLAIPDWCSASYRAMLLEMPVTDRDQLVRQLIANERRATREREREHARWRAGNPLIALYGPGPDGATCKTCTHLFCAYDPRG